MDETKFSDDLEQPKTVRRDNADGGWVDQFGKIRHDAPPPSPTRETFRPYKPNVNYERNPNNRGGDESGEAWEVRNGKVYNKATGRLAESGKEESLSTFGGPLVRGMSTRRI